MTETEEPPGGNRKPRRNRGLTVDASHISANISKGLYQRLDMFAKAGGIDVGLAAALRMVLDAGLSAKGF